jgi:hypothetical protein
LHSVAGRSTVWAVRGAEAQQAASERALHSAVASERLAGDFADEDSKGGARWIGEPIGRPLARFYEGAAMSVPPLFDSREKFGAVKKITPLMLY